MMSSSAVPDPAAATYAAVDLGSNSFHLVIGRNDRGTIQIIDRHKETVRLAAGLTADKCLTPEVATRALVSLARIGQRVRDMAAANVRAVGTNTLRQLRPDCDFLDRAQAALGHPIEIIAGREEARLIYLGVAHGLASTGERRLVVDIGGGSTELIIGEGFAPLLRESLHIGCVTMTATAFPNGRITARALERAELLAAIELHPIRTSFRRTGWHMAVGTSGTIRAVAAVLAAAGWCEDGIDRAGLTRLRAALLERGHSSALPFKSLSDDRRPIFAGGVAVLSAVFEQLGIERMQVSELALREGLLYEMIGRTHHEDVRERTVASIAQRFDVDTAQAERVARTALELLEQARTAWDVRQPQDALLLEWAARLHEIGLAVAHSQYQKHGAYLLRNADLPGFTRPEQETLAALVLGHRRKFPSEAFEVLPSFVRERARRLCWLLRLAALIHRGRSERAKPCPSLAVRTNGLQLTFPPGWLDHHPLTKLELAEEAERLAAIGVQLEYR